MLDSKQRSFLRSMSNKVDAILQVGKLGLTPEVTTSVDEALEKREIVKITVLNNCMEDSRDIANTLQERTHSEIVHVIGKKIVLFRQNKNKPIIELPKNKDKK